MDTMKLLLGATIAVLVGALALSWQGMNHGVKNASPDEIARLKKQISELRADQEKLNAEKAQQPRAPIPPPQAEPNAELEAMKHQLEEVEKKQNESRDKKVAQDEEGLLAQRGLESADSELRRARLISQSLLVGKVKEFVENADVGDFITFDVLMREQIQAGATIAIRRKTGILGQFKVTEVTDDGAVASPLPGFAPVKPLPGDELILPPQY
jgi:type IV secretory pathway VirB10-like protein